MPTPSKSVQRVDPTLRSSRGGLRLYHGSPEKRGRFVHARAINGGGLITRQPVLHLADERPAGIKAKALTTETTEVTEIF